LYFSRKMMMVMMMMKAVATLVQWPLMMMMMMKAVATLVQWPQTGGCERANQTRIERKGSAVPPCIDGLEWSKVE
jgi:hypothetical protein